MRWQRYAILLSFLLWPFCPALATTPSLHQAVADIKSMSDDRQRVGAFRALAEKLARENDRFGKITGKAVSPSRNIPGADAVARFEEETKAQAQKVSGDVVIRTPLPSNFGDFIPDLPHPERLAYDTAYVRGLMPQPTPTLKVQTMPYDLCLYNIKLVYANGRADFMERQHSATPEILYLEEGAATLPQLYAALQAQGVGDDVLVQEGNIYTLRRPLVIAPGATLMITGKEVAELRLAEESGAYIVNAGSLFVVETRLTGWREKENAPAWATYASSKNFRPFLMAWSDTHTYLAGSVFTALGYANSKSYGITISSGPERMLRFKKESIPAPTAVIVDNSFRNLYYGFYCFEAEGVALIGNEYVNNIIYGIDPHDYSKGLTIAYNTAYGSEKKHGIIISREVNHATIVGNLTFENHGSGMMLERQSSDTLVYANTSFSNTQDGLTIYESSCSITAANQFLANQRMGVNIRNSVDVGLFHNRMAHNARAGIQGYIVNLHTAPGQEKRDYTLDPYTEMVGFSAVGNQIEANGHGIQAENMAALYLRANRFLEQSPHLFRGEWSALLPQALAEHNMAKEGILVTRTCSPPGDVAIRECSFRKQGYFAGDGQDNLLQRMQDASCNTPPPAGEEK